ncbi:MAG: DUF427 domain-containing protein, partial [Bacteroidota bacterium]
MNIKKIKPGPGQESVWDYPRPPRLEPFSGHIRVVFNGKEIVSSNRTYRILETSHPPTFYIPMADFVEGSLMKTTKSSFCEWKGMATYYHVQAGGKEVQNAAWGYPSVNQRYSELAGT